MYVYYYLLPWLQVLIFSQMTKMLDLIEDFCHVRRHEYCRLDGETDVHTRGEQVTLYINSINYSDRMLLK